MTDPFHCPACTATLIPGVDACVNCGEPAAARPPQITAQVIGMTLPTRDELVELQAREALAQGYVRNVTTGRALEIAGDVEGAIGIYEAMLTEGVPFTPPYQRLAIIYRRAKRVEDEERVVRKALGLFTRHGAAQWFILRLAGLLARQRKTPKG